MNEKWSPPRMFGHSWVYSAPNVRSKKMCIKSNRIETEISTEWPIYSSREKRKKEWRKIENLPKSGWMTFGYCQIFERFFCSINRNSFLYEIVAAVANTQHMHEFMFYFVQFEQIIICCSLSGLRFAFILFEIIFFRSYFYFQFFAINFHWISTIYSDDCPSNRWIFFALMRH